MKAAKHTGYTGLSILSNATVTLEQVTDAYNLNRACRRVTKNKGAPGIDGLSAHEYAARRAVQGYEDLTEKIEQGKYRPQPVKRGYIPKDNGDRRPLGIPAVEDRVVQQAIANVLSDFYESRFS